jgi:hypothetical protein
MFQFPIGRPNKELPMFGLGGVPGGAGQGASDSKKQPMCVSLACGRAEGAVCRRVGDRGNTLEDGVGDDVKGCGDSVELDGRGVLVGAGEDDGRETPERSYRYRASRAASCSVQ